MFFIALRLRANFAFGWDLHLTNIAPLLFRLYWGYKDELAKWYKTKIPGKFNLLCCFES